MKKYHFTHEPCSLIRAVKHCASHSHFDERFPLRTLARWHSVPFLLVQVGIAHRTLRAEGEQHCCALLAFPMAPGGWVSRASPTEKKCGCCGHAAHMGPWSLQGEMLMERLIPQDLAVGRSSLTLILAATNTATAENHHSSTSPRGAAICQMASQGPAPKCVGQAGPQCQPNT